MGMSTVAPLSCGFIIVTSILFGIGTDLGNIADLAWIVSGWSIASSVSFSLAGSLSDIFGRRNAILAGQLFSLIGAVSLPMNLSPS
jgi:MFS family permease